MPSLRRFNRPGLLALVRVFLAPTAVADSWAGAWLVLVSRGGAADPLVLGALAAMSVSTYWFGMVANDLFDLEKDREGAGVAGKPLVSGAVSVRLALALAFALLTVGGGLAIALGVELIWAALLLAVLAYDAGVKRIPVLGNVVMGSCRGLNFLLGAAVVGGELSQSAVLLPAGILALFIAGVTAVSRLEDRDPRRRDLAPALVLHAAPFFALPIVFVAFDSGDWVNIANAVVLAAALAGALRGGWRAAGSERAPVHGAAIFVRRSLGAIFFVDAGCLLAFSGATPSAQAVPVATLYGLFVVTWWWKRRWVRAGAHGS